MLKDFIATPDGVLARADGQPVARRIYASGYSYVYVPELRKQMLEHRLLWLVAYGVEPGRLDHIDRDRSKNVLHNLREARASDNSQNRSKMSNNQSGIKGLHWCSNQSTWVGQIYHEGKLHKKKSKDKEVVSEWLLQKRTVLCGDFCCH